MFLRLEPFFFLKINTASLRKTTTSNNKRVSGLKCSSKRDTKAMVQFAASIHVVDFVRG
jgi:hypothetical protein